ncbi:hypothetical protein ACOQFL_13700 [Actinopolyspora sp. H202]|uniref:hypothetical protein n=1 Tax=Actinopolyspora sp. H202 TaxID=1500456 RepID=UPI003EE45E91
MADMQEVLAAINVAIEKLDSNASGNALRQYEELEQLLQSLNGVPAYEQAAQAYNGLISSLRESISAEQQLKQTLEQAKATFHGGF